jgi:serine/threonine protein kinase
MMSDHDTSGSEMFGQTISSYRIESWLGAGSLGIVFRAVRVNTGETVAIKVARDHCESAPNRLYRSCEILAQLDHENIVPIMELGQADGKAYSVMEFIPGLTLAKVVAGRGALPWPEAVGIGLQICSALTYIHERGVVHCNLKPSHLILSPNGQLKLTGFGLAKRDGTSIVPAGSIEGTPGYIAPELIDGVIPTYNQAIDFYALGVVFRFLLIGEPPFQEPSDIDRRGGEAVPAFAHLTRPVPRLSERIQSIPNALDDLVLQLMDHAPDRRPRDAAAVASVLSTLPE